MPIPKDQSEKVQHSAPRCLVLAALVVIHGVDYLHTILHQNHFHISGEDRDVVGHVLLLTLTVPSISHFWKFCLPGCGLSMFPPHCATIQSTNLCSRSGSYFWSIFSCTSRLSP
ncbi:hypothetical protein INR49_014500 [Caranx melampygus]|nr:hypothetical protein INR49_014500 [Caranx melampygus]